MSIIRQYELDRVQAEQEYVDATGSSGNSATAESAAGIANLHTLVEYNDNLSKYYLKQAELYYNILGFKYNQMIYDEQTNSANGNFVSMQDSYDKLRVDGLASPWPGNFFTEDSLPGCIIGCAFHRAQE